MKTTTLFLSIFSALSLQAQETYLQTDFNKGIPSDYTNLDIDELPVGNGFGNITVAENWFTNPIYGAEGKAAVSTSRHTFELPAENWLITPQIEIKSANAIFSWDAKSVHYDLRDGYKIMISTSGNQPEDFKELCNVDAESYTWQHHLISLADYVGKKVYIAVLHDSQNKFLLAVDNFYAGEPKDLAFDADNKTKHFCGNTGKTTVEGSLRNIGKSVQVAKITCTSGLHVFTQEMNNVDMKSAAVSDFKFEIPVTLNTTVPYQVDVVTTDGETVKVFDSSIICSYFPRTLLVEKGTGIGCTACPSLMGYMNELKEEYKDEVVEIEAHSTYFDYSKLLAYDIYDLGMTTANYPILYFNRMRKYKAYSKPEGEIMLKEALKEETPALITAKANMKDGKIAVHADMAFGKQLDNSKDQYRIGFAILEKHIQLPFDAQKSAATNTDAQEFAFLASPFAKDLMFFHNTVKGTPNAFTGIANSLPANLEAGSSYAYDGTIDLPQGKSSADGLTVVAFVLDYFNTRILNTVEIGIGNDETGIHALDAEKLNANISVANNECVVNFPESAAYHVGIYDLSGRRIAASSANGDHYSIATSKMGKGTFVVMAQQNGKRISQKIQVEK